MTLNKTIENICKSKEGFFNVSTNIYVKIKLQIDGTIKIKFIYSDGDTDFDLALPNNLDSNFDCLKKNMILKGIASNKPYKVIDRNKKLLIKFF